MKKRSIGVLAIAGVSAALFVLAPSRASAFNGNLVVCNPSPGHKTAVAIKKGFTCEETLNTLTIKGALMDNCTANASAPWGIWATGKFGSKIAAADAATATGLTISLKAIAFGTCNFSGSPDDTGASGAGSFALLNTAGKKVKNGGGAFVAHVVGAGTNAGMSGIVTKGFGLNAEIYVTIGIDTGDPVNSELLACNLGGACPPELAAPATVLDIVTVTGNVAVIGYPLTSECTDVMAPYTCCTGAGTGNC